MQTFLLFLPDFMNTQAVPLLIQNPGNATVTPLYGCIL